MWSGWAASRTGQLSDTASQHPFCGWQGGHHPRWQYPPPQSEMITPTIGDGRPTWPPNDTAKPSRTERSTGFRVTSGDLGTHAMHPPRKRESIGTNATHPPGKRIIHINKCQDRIDTRGRIRRTAPTQRFVIRPSTIKHLRLTSRRRVECGAGGPLAGLVSYRILQASTHSAAGRAGTIVDGNIRRRNPK